MKCAYGSHNSTLERPQTQITHLSHLKPPRRKGHILYKFDCSHIKNNLACLPLGCVENSDGVSIQRRAQT